MAGSWGVSPLMIGLTVVAFGTSAPELMVSVGGAYSGFSDIAVGNVVGSNIFNILLILGLSALLSPMALNRQMVRQEVPLMIGFSVLAMVFALNGSFGRLEGLVLTLLLVGYVGLTIYQGRREGARTEQEPQEPPKGLAGTVWGQVVLVGIGLAGLGLGARWFVFGATDIARALGVSELIIALTVVSAGTSLPEVAASTLAALRGQRDLAVGNVVGSNIFNILCVLGVTSLVSPRPLVVAPEAMAFDFPVMLATAAVCLPIFFTGWIISRWEGGLLLGYYLAYTSYLVLRAMDHHYEEVFGNVLLYVVVPLTVLALVVSLWASRHQFSRAG